MGGVRAKPFSREREEGGRRRMNMASCTTFDLPSTNLDSDMPSITFDWHMSCALSDHQGNDLSYSHGF